MKKLKVLTTCLSAISLTALLGGCTVPYNPEQPSHTEHEYITETIAPTQTVNGYDLHTCECGDNYKDNYTCLITFDNFNPASAPCQLEPIIVSQGSVFNEVDNVGDYNVTEYRSYLTNDFYTNLYPGYTISNSCTVTLVWDQTSYSPPTDTQLTFTELINKIEMLENISKQYNVEKNSTKDPYIRSLQYIRQVRYNTSQWNMIAGTLESDFAQYVADKQIGYNLSELQTIDTFTNVNSGKKVDFVHMMATMNVILKNNSINHTASDLAGWAGDLCQLALELKTSGLTGDDLSSLAVNLFNNTSSSFSCYDVDADFDAINIASIYNNLLTNKSISYAIKQYYTAVNTAKQKQDVLLNAFPTVINSQTGEITKTQSKFANEIIARLKSNLYITIWCNTNNISFTNDSEMFTASANAFANYLLD